MTATLFDFPMPIETPRLQLRPPQSEDTLSINAAVIESINELRPFMPWARNAPTVEETETFIKLAMANWILKKNEEPYLPLFIFDKNTHHFIGGTGFHHFDQDVPCIEIGYWVRSTCAKQGFMTEAVNALTRYAFQQLGVKRVAITCAVDNNRSKKIAERLGYHLEGTLKYNRLTFDGQLSSTLIFARYDLSELISLEKATPSNEHHFFIENLKNLIRYHGLNIPELAQQTRIPQELINQWLSGSQNPFNRNEIEKVARFFDIPIEKLACELLTRFL